MDTHEEGKIDSRLKGEFDLSAASARMWPSTRRSLCVEVGVLVFLLGLAAFNSVSWVEVARRPLTSYQVIGMSSIEVMSVGVAGWLAHLIPRRVRGANSLRVDERGFELIYPNGRRVARAWSDPDLSFDLVDFSGANRSVLMEPEFPRSILLEHVESPLTVEAFCALREQISRHRLVDSSGRGSRWLYPPTAIPVIYRVRPLAARGQGF